jgi:hypothetical protein
MPPNVFGNRFHCHRAALCHHKECRRLGVDDVNRTSQLPAKSVGLPLDTIPRCIRISSQVLVEDEHRLLATSEQVGCFVEQEVPPRDRVESRRNVVRGGLRAADLEVV